MSQIQSVDMGDAIRRMATTSPVLATVLQVMRAEWAPDDPPNTLLFSAFGRTLCCEIKSLTPSQLKASWKAVEDLAVNGSSEVQNAVKTGLIEAVLSESSSGRFNVASVTQLLGPSTRAYCKAWDDFTGCKTEGLQ
jgi:hypothetical protein